MNQNELICLDMLNVLINKFVNITGQTTRIGTTPEIFVICDY